MKLTSLDQTLLLEFRVPTAPELRSGLCVNFFGSRTVAQGPLCQMHESVGWTWRLACCRGADAAGCSLRAVRVVRGWEWTRR